MKSILAQRNYLIGAFLLILLAIGIFFTLSAVKKPQELRKKAAVPSEQGSATVTLSPADRPFTVGQAAAIALSANIQTSKVDGFQVVAYFAGEVPDNLSFVPATVAGLTRVKSAIEDVPQTGDPNAPSSKLTLAYITEKPDAQFPGTGIPVALGTLSFTPQATGSMQVTYDNTLSKITKSDKSAPLPNDQVKDILIFPENSTLTFATPTPTNSPTPTITPSPTSTSTPTPSPTPPVSFGPGELTDILVVPSVNAQGVVTLSISGSRATNLTMLNGEYRYLTQSGSSNFSPNTTLVNIAFSKGQTEFIGSASNLRSGCMDLLSNTTYVASVCLTIQFNTRVLYGADTRLPYRYSGGIYDWGYLRQQVFFSGTLNTQVSPVYFLSSTLAFDKNNTPYWRNAGNFLPTYYYWTDSVTNGTSSVSNLFPTMMDTPSIGCYNNEWVSLGAFSTKYLIPSSSYYGLNSVPFGNSPGPCIFYTYAGQQIQSFNDLRNKYTTIVPFVGPTPTSTPTPSPTISPTISPTPTPLVCQKEDINRDGYVDIKDYNILLQNFFSTTPAQPRADINSDGIVDLTDYSLLVIKYDPTHQHGTPGCQ